MPSNLHTSSEDVRGNLPPSVLEATTNMPTTPRMNGSTTRDTTATFMDIVAGRRKVKFSTSDDRGWVTVENVKVSTSGQGKGVFDKMPDAGCTIELPDDLARAVVLEAEREGCPGIDETLSLDKLVIGTLTFACKRVDETVLVNVEPAEYLQRPFHEYANIASLSTEYPRGFTMSGKLSFQVEEGNSPIIVAATVREGNITGATAQV